MNDHKIKDEAKKKGHAIGVSDFERWFLLAIFNTVSTANNVERRRLDTTFEALKLDDFETTFKDGLTVGELSKEFAEYKVTGDVIDFVVEKLNLPLSEKLGALAHRTIGRVCDRFSDVKEGKYELPEELKAAAVELAKTL